MNDYTKIGDLVQTTQTVSGSYVDWSGNGLVTTPAYYYWPTYIQTEPKDCMGKAHVFECEHVNACKCGAIKRVMPRAKKAAKK